MRRLSTATLLAVAVTLTGCAGGPSLFGSATPAQPTAELSMPGRWMLSAPNAPACGMNFSAAAGQNIGTVVPEGGCPGRFYTSRRWALEKDTLTIIDDENNNLATLTFAGGQFEGKSADDTPVTLAH
jgi:Protease inhibitor Inh